MGRPATTVKVDIGDMVVLISARRPESIAHIRDRYRAFLSGREPDFEIETPGRMAPPAGIAPIRARQRTGIGVLSLERNRQTPS
jgi:hypothetical protein